MLFELLIFTHYCAIIIVCWEPMFAAFMGNPSPQIYTLTNIYISICLILFKKIIPNLLPMNIDLQG